MRRFSPLLTLVFFIAASMLPHTLHAIPPDQDTDGDTIPDVQEDANGNGIVDNGETDPLNTDTDGGGESDVSEIRAKRNPLDKTDDLTYDTDGDGWVNGFELTHGTDPKKADTDGDGINDSVDPFPLDAKYSADSNSNGLPDDWERTTQLDRQTIPQSKTDDPDQDGLNNAQELARGTNPVEADSDRDGISDSDEIDHGSNPRENACLQYQVGLAHFPDLVSHWAEPYVTMLKDTTILPQKIALVRGYQLGSKNGSRSIFDPEKPVTRFEFLKMAMLGSCTRLMNASDQEHAFSDLSALAPLNETADVTLRRQVIYTAVHYGIVAGYSDGTFRPDAPVNRAEAVKMLLLAVQFPPVHTSTGSLHFADVQPSDWFAPYVDEASEREIVRGYTDGTFRGHLLITRAEAAKIVAVSMKQNPLVNGYVLPPEMKA